MQHLDMKPGHIVMAKPTDSISAIIGQLSEADISQIPVTDENGWIKGIVRESIILKAIFNN